MKEEQFVEKINRLGGKAYIAGGWVRDRLRNVEAHDKDYVLAGIEESTFCEAFPQASKVGKSFPVYLLEIDRKISEVAFARKERKVGAGYRGFAVSYDSAVSIEDDLYRRDTTMNSIAYCLQSGKFIDPYGGIGDIRQKRIRATSRHFLEDPVRALRAARQAAQLQFEIEKDTIYLMNECKRELALEPAERMVAELDKALRANQPSIFFYCLKEAKLLSVAYPPLFENNNIFEQSFAAAMQMVDRTAELTRRAEVRFAALALNIGGGCLHGRGALAGLERFNRQMTLPRLWMSCAELAALEHKRAVSIKDMDDIVDLLIRVNKNPIGFDGFNCIIQAEHGFLPEFLNRHSAYMEKIGEIRGGDAPRALRGKEIGAWIRRAQIDACKLLQPHGKH